MALSQAAATPALLDFSDDEVARIVRHGPWPPPPVLDAGNAQAGRPAAIALGERLFFDARLSIDGTLSCASCHRPEQAFADGRARGLGRQRLDRNTPSLWNAVHERWYGWDGAADSLWSQAIRPILDAREMAANATHVRTTIAGDGELACRYVQAFGQAASGDDEAVLVNAAKAIGAFVGTLQSGRTAFDDFRDALARGDRAAAARYPLPAQRGARLFVGRGRCHLCHVGPLFSNGEFGDTGLPFFVRPGVVDPGRHGGIAALRSSAYNLLSRWSDAPDPSTSIKTRHVQAQHRNFGEFKVPGLRNVALDRTLHARRAARHAARRGESLLGARSRSPACRWRAHPRAAAPERGRARRSGRVSRDPERSARHGMAAAAGDRGLQKLIARWFVRCNRSGACQKTGDGHSRSEAVGRDGLLSGSQPGSGITCEAWRLRAWSTRS